jgi:hypothetical protein
MEAIKKAKLQAEKKVHVKDDKKKIEKVLPKDQKK